MRYIVYGKRFGGEHLDIREFITPNTPSVQEAVAELPKDGDPVWNCWDWVCKNIQYPPICAGAQDYHEKISFLRSNPILRTPVKHSRQLDDFWELPWEVLDPPRYGDCEGSSVVLVSMLRNFLSTKDVYCAVGTYQGHGHAWVTVNDVVKWYTLDTTISKAKPNRFSAVIEGSPYIPFIRFNDQDVVVERDGWQDFLNFHT